MLWNATTNIGMGHAIGSDGTVYIAARYTPPGNDAREGSEIDMNRCNNLLLIHICNFYIVLERNVRFECAPLYISRMRTM